MKRKVGKGDEAHHSTWHQQVEIKEANAHARATRQVQWIAKREERKSHEYLSCEDRCSTERFRQFTLRTWPQKEEWLHFAHHTLVNKSLCKKKDRTENNDSEKTRSGKQFEAVSCCRLFLFFTYFVLESTSVSSSFFFSVFLFCFPGETHVCRAFVDVLPLSSSDGSLYVSTVAWVWWFRLLRRTVFSPLTSSSTAVEFRHLAGREKPNNTEEPQITLQGRGKREDDLYCVRLFLFSVSVVFFIFHLLPLPAHRYPRDHHR
jgi:hypothetical protein